jgi:hypothetical protein
MKIEIYFKKILGEKVSLSELYKWLEKNNRVVNETFEKKIEEDHYDYYYHIY